METAYTVIVGGGIAGLIVAEELAKRGEPVIVLEKYPFFGGRINTHRDDNLQYEIGAGRIRPTGIINRHPNHSRVPVYNFLGLKTVRRILKPAQSAGFKCPRV